MTDSKILFCLIEYKEYPVDKTALRYELAELSKEQIYDFILMFGNGVIGECRFVCENLTGVEIIRALTLGVGKATHHILSDNEQTSLWLLQSGDECYIQEGDPYGYIFIDPTPHPEKFEIGN